MSAVLTDVDTVEVSLVDRGANMKRFALRKQEKQMAKVTMTKAQREKLAKALSGKTFAQVQKALADVTPEGRKAIMAAIGILANAKADLPDGLLQEMMSAAGIETPDDMVDLIAGDSAADEADDDMPGEDGGDIEGEPVADSAPSTTPGENMPGKTPPPTVPQQKDDMYKSQIAKAQKDADEAKTQLATLEKQAKEDAAKRTELEKAFAAERSVRLEKEYIAKAMKLSNVVGVVKAEDLGPVLKALNDAAPEQAAKLEKFFEQLNEKLGKTDELLKELGRSNAEAAPSTAMEALEKAAAELMKGDAKLTKAVAFKKALDANPKLYEAYNQEKAEAA